MKPVMCGLPKKNRTSTENKEVWRPKRKKEKHNHELFRDPTTPVLSPTSHPPSLSTRKRKKAKGKRPRA